MEKFRINNDLSIFWSITEKDGSPYTLSDKTVRLFVTGPRGRMDVTSDITVQDNVICWLFRGSRQRYLGTYKITVEIQASPADRTIRKDIPEAFELVSSTQYEQTEIGRPDINEEGELTLATSLDIFQIQPIIPQVGPNRNWWVDGADTGKSSVGLTAYEFAKEQGYEGTEEEYAAECLAVPVLNEESRSATAEARVATEMSIAQHESVSNYMNDVAEPTVAAAAQVAKDVRSEADAVLEEVGAAIASVNQAAENANNAAAEATEAASKAAKDVQTAIAEIAPALDNKADKIKFEGKSYVETDGISTNDFYYSMPDSADGTEDDIIATKSNLKKINGQDLYGKGNIVIEGKNYNNEISALQQKDAEQSAKLAELSDEVGELSERIEDINVESVGIYLPDTIHAVVGDTLQIFFRSVVDCAGIDAYDISAVCSYGKSYPRYWEYKATEAGSFALTLNVRTSASKIVATRQVTIRVVDAKTSPSATQRILCIGASATQGGQWVGELNRRLTATSGNGTPANPTGLGLSNIEFVGRKVGTVSAINLEATGGWRVQDYAGKGERAIRFQVTGVDTLSVGAIYKLGSNLFIIQEVNVTEGQGNIRCTLQSSYTAPSASGVMTKSSGAGDASITYSSYTEETFSPFWNDTTNKLDFKQYADKFCNGSIDVMIWHCGVNDIFAGTPESIDAAIAAFHNILAQYNEDFPNGKVIISSVPIGSLNGGFAANYGASENGNAMVFMHQAQVYAKRLQDLCNEYAFTTYAPVLEEFDAENGYPTKTAPVNNRASETEVVGTNAVHPTTEGSYLVADAIYRAFNTLVLHSPVLADRWMGGSNMDYNPYVSSASFVTEYARGAQITLRKYNTGAIIRAFVEGYTAWGVVDYNIFNGRKNGDVIPLVITQSGTMNVPVGTIVGHIVFNDIAGFKALPNDDGNGQEFIWVDPDDGKMVASGEYIYLTTTAALRTTSSPRGVMSFRVSNGNTYELYIPKTGNEYAAHYAFGKSSSKGNVETNVILTNAVGTGDEQPATHTITAGANPFLYVCYTLDGGVPTLKKL